MVSLLFFCLLSCSKKDIKTIILNKADYADSLEHSIVNNTQTYVIREGKTPSYKISKLNDGDGYAIISILPKMKIHRNFLKDSVDISFVNAFRLIDCQYLIRKDSFIRIDFEINEKKYILYKNPLPNLSYLPIDTTIAIKLNTKWCYVELDKNDKR